MVAKVDGKIRPFGLTPKSFQTKPKAQRRIRKLRVRAMEKIFFGKVSADMFVSKSALLMVRIHEPKKYPF